MTFFFDNNLSKQLSDGMSGFGEATTHLLDHFQPEVEDLAWIPQIGTNGWFLITRDEQIRRNPAERQAILAAKLGVFFLGGKQRKRCQLIQQLVRHWPRIKELSVKTSRPFAFVIPPTGTKIIKVPLS